MRAAPSIEVINGLLAAGASVRAYDPQAMDNARHEFGDRITYCEGNYDCLENADALLVITEWSAFRRPDFERVARMLKEPLVFDGRNLYDPERLAKRGFTYYAVGRGLPV